MYYLIYQEETDGDIIIRSLNSGDEVYRFIKEISLVPNDYALVKGNILKDFNNKSFNVKSLKGVY